ncbi:MAG: hypothetical protein ACFFDH_09445 [Promethearchaeota archaeon]
MEFLKQMIKGLDNIKFEIEFIREDDPPYHCGDMSLPELNQYLMTHTKKVKRIKIYEQ